MILKCIHNFKNHLFLNGFRTYDRHGGAHFANIQEFLVDLELPNEGNAMSTILSKTKYKLLFFCTTHLGNPFFLETWCTNIHVQESHSVPQFELWAGVTNKTKSTQNGQF